MVDLFTASKERPTFEAEMIFEKSTGFPSWSTALAASSSIRDSLLFLPAKMVEMHVGMATGALE